jgi:hypothetical protein
VIDEQFYDTAHADLFVVGEGFKPTSELIGALNVPRHGLIMP